MKFRVRIGKTTDLNYEEIKEFRDYNEMFQYIFSRCDYVHVEKSEVYKGCDFFAGMDFTDEEVMKEEMLQR